MNEAVELTEVSLGLLLLEKEVHPQGRSISMSIE